MAASDHRRKRISAFLQLADEEMRAAQTLLTSLPRQSAFFQQQCVEKLLRAVLESSDVPAGPTHNLRTLTDLLPSDHAMHSTFLAFEEFSSSATRYRYPSGSGDAPEISANLVESRQERVAALRDAVIAYLNNNKNFGSKS
jgi:HEPN domain-containing protein